MKNRLGYSLALLLFVPQTLFAQADPQTVAKIVDEGKNHSQIMAHLQHLTKNIGHRLTGSPQLDRAYDWTQKKFKEFGCKNVRLEEWGEFPVGFDRGKRQWGKMIYPEKLNFEFTSASWTAGTKGALRGPALPEPTTMEEFNAVKDNLKGKWLVSKRTTGFRGGTPLPEDVAKALKESGILGTVFGSRSDLVLTGGLFRIKWEELPTDVRVTVRKKIWTRSWRNSTRSRR